MSFTSTLSGIVSSHLQRYARWIEDEFNAIAKEAVADQLTGFSTDFIDAVTSIDSAKISDVVRSGGDPKRLARVIASPGPIRLINRGPYDPIRRPSKKPGEVRGGNLRSINGTSSGKPGLERPQSSGNGAPGPSDDRLQSNLLEEAIALAKDCLGEKGAEDLLRRLREADEKGSKPGGGGTT